MDKKFWILIMSTTLLLALSGCSWLEGWGMDDPDSNSAADPTQPGDVQIIEAVNQPANNSASMDDQGGCKNRLSGTANLSPNEIFEPGQEVPITWTLTNQGGCTWDSEYQLKLVAGELEISDLSLAVPQDVHPGEVVNIQTTLLIPEEEGQFSSAWKMEDSRGRLFGEGNPADQPLIIKVRAFSSGGQQPTPAPTQAPQQPENQTEDLESLLADECYDLNSGKPVACSDSTADIQFRNDLMGAKIYNRGNTTFGSNHAQEPDQSDCAGETYAPLPHTPQQGSYFCFQIDTVAVTQQGWIRVERFDEQGITFEYQLFAPEMPEPILNESMFVLSADDQVTLQEGECFDVQQGELVQGCIGIFAGFRFEETTKKSLQVMQIYPLELSFSQPMEAEPTREDCQNAAYSSSPIWPITETSYSCYQFVPGTTAYYGWLRPTDFNGSGMTFDYLTWDVLQ